MDLPLGRLKFTTGGGSAGHKGLESILGEMPADFDRLRVGIGRPEKNFFVEKAADYVLAPFNSLENDKVNLTLDWASDLVRVWVIKNMAAAQMLGNRPEPAQKKKAKSAKSPEEAKTDDLNNSNNSNSDIKEVSLTAE
jgi:PTH1 family peptidyl-tRNA hydrolase